LPALINNAARNGGVLFPGETGQCQRQFEQVFGLCFLRRRFTIEGNPAFRRLNPFRPVCKAETTSAA